MVCRHEHGTRADAGALTIRRRQRQPLLILVGQDSNEWARVARDRHTASSEYLPHPAARGRA